MMSLAFSVNSVNRSQHHRLSSSSDLALFEAHEKRAPDSSTLWLQSRFPWPSVPGALPLTKCSHRIRTTVYTTSIRARHKCEGGAALFLSFPTFGEGAKGPIFGEARSGVAPGGHAVG